MKNLMSVILNGMKQGKKDIVQLETNSQQYDLQNAAELKSSMNVAAPLVTGLDMLKSQPGSAFEYKIVEKGSSIEIITNIPALDVFGYCRNFTAPFAKNTSKISVYANGVFSIDAGYTQDKELNKRTNQTLHTKKLEEALEFVARQAVVQKVIM